MRREARTRVSGPTLACLLAISCTPSDGNPDTGTVDSSSSGAATSSGSSATTTTTSTGATATEPANSTDPSTSAASAPTSSASGATPDIGVQCREATQPCEDPSECCAEMGLTCATTTLGMVCCGVEGTSCATANGEDCCGDLLCVAGTCLPPGGMPLFQAPFPCGQSWTYSHHDAEVRRALDFIDNGGNTNGAPVLAALEGVATRHVQGDGAGNYIVIEHGGGWKTYYFHLQSFSVEDNTFVEQGQEIGLTGSTGKSSGPHIHFEELLNGEGMDIWLDGQPLAPYPGSYGQASITSNNCP